VNNPILRLYEDELAIGAPAIELPPRPRMIFLARGSINGGGRTVPAEDVWCGEGAIRIEPGADGASCWRFELAAAASGEGALRGASARSTCKIAASVATLPKGELIMRGDSVAFPPGGCAYLHRHQGPGIRCLFEGAIRIDTEGRSTQYGPGEAWYEAGPDPVFAQAAMDRRTRFIRFMILPRELIGKSSIQYLDERDKSKPRLQEYRIFTDQPISEDG
jgi:hypothetical protein